MRKVNMESWLKKISKNPRIDLEKSITRCRNKKEVKNLVNGKKYHLEKWNPLQTVLFWKATDHKDLIFLLIKHGADPNSLSRSGLNFFHLYLLLLHYSPSYRNPESFEFFLDLLRFGFNANKIIFYRSKGFYILDVLYLLNKSSLFSLQFFSTRIQKKSSFHYEKLPKENYNTLVLLNLCLGGKYRLLDHNFLRIRFDNIEKYLYIVFFKQYILQKFKLPKEIDDGEIQKRINFLGRNRSHVEKINNSLQKLSNEDIPINFLPDQKSTFYNSNFIENYLLQAYEFLPPIEVRGTKMFFHQNFFLEIFLSKENIFTREPIADNIMNNWLNYIQKTYCFPLTTLQDSLENYPLIFCENYCEEKFFHLKTLVSFLEEIFSIYNPYNNFPKIQTLRKFELSYICHNLVYQSKLFTKFKKLIQNPNINKIAFLILQYYQKLEKNMNILCYFFEESLQDLKSYEKVKGLLQSLEEPSNSNRFFQEYLFRFQEFHPIYMKKFIENMLTILRLENSS